MEIVFYDMPLELWCPVKYSGRIRPSQTDLDGIPPLQECWLLGDDTAPSDSTAIYK